MIPNGNFSCFIGMQRTNIYFGLQPGRKIFFWSTNQPTKHEFIRNLKKKFKNQNFFYIISIYLKKGVR